MKKYILGLITLAILIIPSPVLACRVSDPGDLIVVGSLSVMWAKSLPFPVLATVVSDDQCIGLREYEPVLTITAYLLLLVIAIIAYREIVSRRKNKNKV